MNKRKNITEYIRTLSHIKLGESSRARMRAELSAYADLHELKEEAVLVRKSTFSFLSYFRTRTSAIAAFAAVLIIGTGTQMTLASEKALPGDLLYPVKVSVREPLELAFASGGEEKAEIATKLAVRRVEEVSILATTGKLNAKTSRDLAARFDSHVEDIEEEASSIEATGRVSEALAVRTLAEAGLALRSEQLENKKGEQDDDEFRTHILEKTKQFGDERARLASALSVTVASTTQIESLDSSEKNTETAIPVLVKVQATTTASSTASTTPKESSSQRIFKSLFFKEQMNTESSLQFINTSGSR
ncbi:hypothetical protein KJ819_02440 [Patescibacteria group bacterium]|nr:hypothetical protein [Patescibacteria group bacterium]MBU1500859.1 hypothetical protein [Patescibacteria group bacterium]MBU2080914.1 hypothetical protein [Patescibacteria group bacterium]MBU2124019.1 hypothetical protein [Patescibacteria group bacterium]MBU2194690.1 hypothetical protein [Patescibacteria group bacterium]